jgi:hypothetical protein
MRVDQFGELVSTMLPLRGLDRLLYARTRSDNTLKGEHEDELGKAYLT